MSFEADKDSNEVVSEKDRKATAARLLEMAKNAPLDLWNLTARSTTEICCTTRRGCRSNF
jgi:hypothetical protein